MRTTCDEFLTLRLPRDLRAALDGEARAAGVKVSVATRTMLAVGLASIRSHPSPDPRDLSPAGTAITATSIDIQPAPFVGIA